MSLINFSLLESDLGDIRRQVTFLWGSSWKYLGNDHWASTFLSKSPWIIICLQANGSHLAHRIISFLSVPHNTHKNPCMAYKVLSREGVFKPTFQRCSSPAWGASICTPRILPWILLLNAKYLCPLIRLGPCHVPVETETHSLMTIQDVLSWPSLPAAKMFTGMCMCGFHWFPEEDLSWISSTCFVTFWWTLSAEFWCHWVFWPMLYILDNGSFRCLLWDVHP